MTDQEGNVYKTIVIGTQEWMAENLNTSIYRNGDAIPTGLSNADWENTTNTQQGAWAYYNNDASYACPYGKLYNWYAVSDARGLCPVGWHVQTDEEWTALKNYLGNNIASGAMKSIGILQEATGFWQAPNNGANNSSGFSGLPGGIKLFNGELGDLGYSGWWWSSTQVNSSNAWAYRLDYFDAEVYSGAGDPQNGFSVRCLRD
jgi:uncharacterized protein (TIGR02145 family)